MKRSTPIKYTANTSRYNIRSKSDKPSGRTDTGVFFFYIYLRSTSFSHVCSPRPSSCDWIMLTDSPTGIVNVQPILEAIWLFLLGSCRRLANAAPSPSISLGFNPDIGSADPLAFIRAHPCAPSFLHTLRIREKLHFFQFMLQNIVSRKNTS